jgi:hypothetical protein
MSAAGILLTDPVIITRLPGGYAPISGAKIQAYLTSSTTPTPVYADGGLTTPLSNPVVANGSGQFPAIYLDPTVTYRLQVQNSAGAVLSDIDPVNLNTVAATQTQVNAGTSTTTFVSPNTLANWTGVIGALGYTPLNKAGDTATNLVLNVTSPAALSAGYLGSPVNTENANYTLLITDAGKTLYQTSGSAYTWTIPTNASVAFPLGTVVGFINTGSGSVTIAPAGGVTMNLAGAGTTGNRTLAQWGVATATKVGTDTWVIGGIGLS